MDILLPNTNNEFTDPNYWKRFFERNSSFEWYGDYHKLSAIFEKYIRPVDSVLQIGCGNSRLAEELYDNGYRNILSIDTDSNVISKQKQRNSIKRALLKFETCSAADMSMVSDSSINVVIDKGTLDALLPPESSDQDEEVVQAMFAEVERTLAPFGRYIIITLAQEHIVRKLLDFFGTNNFIIRLQKSELTETDFVMPVFVFIITKLKNALEKLRKIEYVDSSISLTENVDDIPKLIEKIKGAQQMNWFKHLLSRGPIEETSLKICSSLDGRERYELIIVDDINMKTLCKYGVFIVPFGRESDWLFATPKGRTVLRKNCELHRIIVVRLSRDQHYDSLEKIQNELNSIIIDFMPKACAGQRINYMSLGTTDATETVDKGTSVISGKWTVEHVPINGAMYRRLVFLDSSNLVQSESVVKRANDGQWTIDWTDRPLCCEHHQHMLLSLYFLHDTRGASIDPGMAMDAQLRFVVLGLGGGILAKILHDTFQRSEIVAVELDKEIAEIALKHFEFPGTSERICIEICDAFDFLRESSNPEYAKYDIMFVDLSGPVNEQGLYCPPPEFVTENALTLMRDSLTPGGVLTLNLVTRDDHFTEDVKKTLSTIFNAVYFIQGDEDINEVVICSMVPAQTKSVKLDTLKQKKSKKSSKARQNKNGHSRSGVDGITKKWMSKCLAEADNIQCFSHK